MNPIIQSLKGGLIVSCQALSGNPLRDSESMAKMAEAAELGGAAGIRANGTADLSLIRPRVRLPIIGINKGERSLTVPYITPTFQSAEEIAALGVEIIALDATARPRPDGSTPEELIRRIKDELHVLVMADISTYEEGMAAARAGADLVATTLSGYTSYSPATPGPDFRLIRRLASDAGVPVIGEGRFHSPEDVAEGLRCGALAIVVGKMITNPMYITEYFISRIKEIMP